MINTLRDATETIVASITIDMNRYRRATCRCIGNYHSANVVRFSNRTLLVEWEFNWNPLAEPESRIYSVRIDKPSTYTFVRRMQMKLRITSYAS